MRKRPWFWISTLPLVGGVGILAHNSGICKQAAGRWPEGHPTWEDVSSICV